MPRFSNSIALRLTFNYCILALLTSLLPLAIFYRETTEILESQFALHITNAAGRLETHFGQNGLEGLRREIELELSDSVNNSTEMFLLLDARGEPVIGNLQPSPALAGLRPGAERRLDVVLRGEPVSGMLLAREFPGGVKLIVGHDLRDLYTLTGIVKGVSAATIATILIAILIGAYFFRLSLRRRFGAMRLVASQVGSGELARRIPVETAAGDEFSQLARDINAMLDQIEVLMDGVRNVSDSIAHNLRTPLNRMLAAMHNARTSARSFDELQVYLDSLSNEIDLLAKISEKLLQIAEYESGTRRTRFTMVSLDAIATDVVELYEALAEESGVKMTLRVTGKATVLGDRDLLAGAIMNLVENALKYGGPGGEIVVDVAADEAGATVRVRDHGPGIPEAKRARIGERFFRLHTDQPGYGLGVATVLAICRLHGASFHLANAHPGLVTRIDIPRTPQRDLSVS